MFFTAGSWEKDIFFDGHLFIFCPSYFVKVYIFWEDHKIFRNLYRRFDRYYIGQIYGGDLAKICGLLRINELKSFNNILKIQLIGVDKNFIQNFIKLNQNHDFNFHFCYFVISNS